MAEYDQFGRKIKKKNQSYRLSLFQDEERRRLDPSAVRRLVGATGKLAPLNASTESFDHHSFSRIGSKITYGPPSAASMRQFHLPKGCSPFVKKDIEDRAAAKAKKRMLAAMSTKDRKQAIMDEQLKKRIQEKKLRGIAGSHSLPEITTDSWRHERFKSKPQPNVTVYGDIIEEQWPPDVRRVPKVTKKHWRVKGGVLHYKGERRVWSFKQNDVCAEIIQRSIRSWLARLAFHSMRATQKENEARIKKSLRKIIYHREEACFNSWQLYTKRMKKAKRLLHNAHTGNLHSRFEWWVSVWKQKKSERQAKLATATARFMMREAAHAFRGWHHFTEAMKRAKALFKRHMAGMERHYFDTWVEWRREVVHTRRVMVLALDQLFEKIGVDGIFNSQVEIVMRAEEERIFAARKMKKTQMLVIQTRAIVNLQRQFRGRLGRDIAGRRGEVAKEEKKRKKKSKKILGLIEDEEQRIAVTVKKMNDAGETGAKRANRDINKWIGGSKTKRIYRKEKQDLLNANSQLTAKEAIAQAKQITMEKVRVQKMQFAKQQLEKQARLGIGPGGGKAGSKSAAPQLLADMDLSDSDDDEQGTQVAGEGGAAADQVLLSVQSKWEKQKAKLAAKAEKVLKFDEEAVGLRYDGIGK